MEKQKLETIGTSATSFYVYEHLEEGVVVYVGKGQNYRAWNSGRHNQAHADWMKEKLKWMDETVNIRLTHGLTEEQALAKEKALIKELSPRFNASFDRLEEQRREAIAARIASGVNAAVCSESLSKRNSSKATCPNCGKSGGMMAIARWHGLDGSKCKI